MKFSLRSKSPDCGVILYDVKSGKVLEKIPFVEGERMGYIYTKEMTDLPKGSAYLFWIDDQLVVDERSKAFIKKNSYGEKRTIEDFKSVVLHDEFDWEMDLRPLIEYSQSIFYVIHVRGFTKHVSAGVKHPGTFTGIMEKLDYLKEIGVTSLELQPAYEFTEVSSDFEESTTNSLGYLSEEQEDRLKINYWGYKKGYYYAPKASYSATDNPVNEFKELVKRLHKNRMEMIMQFYFPKEVKKDNIIDILCYWVKEFHVDGFHLMGENLPVQLLAEDDRLADTKLLYYQFDADAVYTGSELPAFPHLAEYNDDYMYQMRRFLKGDDGMLEKALWNMCHIPEKMGRIHYFSNYYGLTLYDMVCFNEKHNEENGENNQDGTDYNCSWNCGEEGYKTKSRKIKKLRIQQIKNAMCLLMMSQSTPLIFMGDEFGNGQNGNNNPYCQDNKVTWIDWKCAKKNEELLNFWKTLVKLRRENQILHPNISLKMVDTMSCGYPEISYHGEEAWRPRINSYIRHIGIMYCGKYVNNRDDQTDFLYLTINMHWEEQNVALPKLPGNREWKRLLSSVDTNCDSVSIVEETDNHSIVLQPRSINVFVAIEKECKKRAKRVSGKNE